MCGGGCAPPTAAGLIRGYAPGSGFALQTYWAKGRPRGIAQTQKARLRRGIATAAHPGAKPNPTGLMTFEAKLSFDVTTKKIGAS